MTQTTYKEDKEFRDDMIGTDLLEKAIKWIKSNFRPEQIFDEDELKEWAENHGYTEAES